MIHNSSSLWHLNLKFVKLGIFVGNGLIKYKTLNIKEIDDMLSYNDEDNINIEFLNLY